MLLPTSLTNRRQFLERSAWGFGSAFLLPSLLTSCTDHNIPGPDGPDGPTITPPLSDDQIDWNDDAKTIVTAGLRLIPVVGGIIGPLVGLLWPNSGNSPWDQVKAQVEILIDQKIDDIEYKTVKEDLNSMESYANDYLYAVNNNGDVQTNYTFLFDTLNGATGDFQLSGYEVLLLPLFVQYANLYLSLLRDTIAFGSQIGISQADIKRATDELPTTIYNFITYATVTWQSGLDKLQNATPRDDVNNEPFMTTNAYNRQMTFWVLDFVDTWQYYDIKKYPKGAVTSDGTPINLFTREIYSDPYGNTYKGGGFSNPIALPAAATQRPTQITVWGGSRIDAVQLTYPTGGGPGGVDKTARMGDQDGGTNQKPKGGIFNVSLGIPIIQAQVSYGNTQIGPYQDLAIDTLQFAFNDGTTNTTYSDQMGGKPGDGNSGWVGYNYMALSSIYIQGVNYNLQNSANCIVFGFLYWSPPAATLRALANIYIMSPKERSLADFVKAYPKLSLSAASITSKLKAARAAYWAYVKSKVK